MADYTELESDLRAMTQRSQAHKDAANAARQEVARLEAAAAELRSKHDRAVARTQKDAKRIRALEDALAAKACAHDALKLRAEEAAAELLAVRGVNATFAREVVRLNDEIRVLYVQLASMFDQKGIKQ
jgi:chromosome segregation ATPase